MPISWYIAEEWINTTKTLQQIETDRTHRLAQLHIGELVTVNKVIIDENSGEITGITPHIALCKLEQNSLMLFIIM